MEQIAIAAHACWFASKDPAFKPYHMANELNSFSGRPRFLLVPAKHYEGKPLLVVQAEGAAPNVQAFGPLMDEALGERITCRHQALVVGFVELPGCSLSLHARRFPANTNRAGQAGAVQEIMRR